MNNFEIFLDLDKFDKTIMNMDESQKKRICWQMNALTQIAEELNVQKKISKIIRNRVGFIWQFSPYRNVQIMPSKRFNELFGIKNPNLKFISNAVKEVLNKNNSLNNDKESQ